MAEPPAPGPRFGPLHPVTRLARVQQQLRSFAGLHRSEIGGVIQQLDEGGLQGFSDRLTAYLDLHAQEMATVIEELEDVAKDLSAASSPGRGASEVQRNAKSDLPQEQQKAVDPSDPAADSPKRARWLTEQANRLLRPVSRRGFLFPGSKPD